MNRRLNCEGVGVVAWYSFVHKCFFFASVKGKFKDKNILGYNFVLGTADGGTVVKVLCYKSEGRWFNSRWCYWTFSFM
jgi:hypothetical protein